MAVPFVAVHAGKWKTVLQSKELRHFSSCSHESTNTGRLESVLCVYVLFIRSVNPSPSLLDVLLIFLSPLLPATPGAGCHNESTSRELKTLCRRTCKEVCSYNNIGGS